MARKSHTNVHHTHYGVFRIREMGRAYPGIDKRV